MGNLYETDIVAWATEQAQLLRSGQWSLLDILNIAEEIEAVGKSEKRELKSRMGILIGHLLKWKFQPGKRSNSWLTTIRIQRLIVEDNLEETPSLKHALSDKHWLQRCWNEGLKLASDDTGIEDIPSQPIWTVEQLRDPSFLPD